MSNYFKLLKMDLTLKKPLLSLHTKIINIISEITWELIRSSILYVTLFHLQTSRGNLQRNKIIHVILKFFVYQKFSII